MFKIKWIFIVLFFPLVALAQAISEPETLEQAIGFLPILIKAFSEGQYLIGGAALTVLLVFAFRKYAMPKLKLGTGVLPLVSAVIGIISGVGISVYGGASPEQAAMAVLSGPLAGTLWDSVLKYFFKK